MDGDSSGSTVQVATVIVAASAPSVTSNTANITDGTTTITINGASFSTTPANDTVTFNLGVAGTSPPRRPRS